MRELSVRCDALTRRGSQCRKPAYESLSNAAGGRVWLCTVHRRQFDEIDGPLCVALDGAGRVVSGPVVTQ